MKPELINIITAVAQVFLAFAALISSIIVSLFVYYGTRRISQLEYDRSIREWWNSIDQLALSSDEMLTIADEIMEPALTNTSVDEKRRRWFSYAILNALASSYMGAKLGLTRSADDTIEIVKHHLQKLLVAEDIFRLSQKGYEADFSRFCRDVRKEVTQKNICLSAPASKAIRRN